MYSIAALAFLSFVLAILLTPVVRNFCRRFGLVDHPGDRKVHQDPVPRVGGISIALAYVGAYGLLLAIGFNANEMLWSARQEIWNFLPAAVSIFAIGLVDDLRGLKPWSKLLAQVGASALAYTGGVHITGIGSHALTHWWSLPLTVIWLLLCTNAVNLIDGIDGLAAGVGLFATTTTLLAALLQHNIGLALAVAPLVGALLGFLRYNFNPATIFLGDSGSLFIGFLLGCYGIRWSQESATMLGMTAPLMALVIPLLDTSLAVVRRFLHNKPIFTADRGHIHHRLLDRGFTPRKAALVLYACCAVGAICSLGMMNSRTSGAVIVVFCAMTWIGIQHLGYVEFGVAGRMFVDGAFRRQINHQLSIVNVRDSLIAAITPDHCWEIIARAAKDFGFHYVRLHLAGKTFEYRDEFSLEKCWTMRVPLSSSDFLEISREFGLSEHSAIVGPLCEEVYNALTPRLAVLRANSEGLIQVLEADARSAGRQELLVQVQEPVP